MTENSRTMWITVWQILALAAVLIGLVGVVAAMPLPRTSPAAGALPAEPPACYDAAAVLTFDYRHAVGSAGYSDPEGDPESGSTFRWLLDGTPLVSGTVAEGLLLHFDGSVDGANGEIPTSTLGVAYASGQWGQALALEDTGRLGFVPDDNLDLTEGTIDLWAALRADGDDPLYTGRWHVLFYYASPGGDWLAIAQDDDSGVLYAGGDVGGQWQSAYGQRANMRGWLAGEWHHLALTYSAAGNFMRFYVDGVLAADTNEGHYWPPATGGAEFTVGGTPWDEAAYYYLDELRISARPATAAEISGRARRLDPPRANEVWLATETLLPSATLVYEYTPSDGLQAGAACSSTQLVYPGLPITNPQPLSTLLPPASTQLTLSLESTQPTTCAYAVGQPLPYEAMTPFDQGAGTTFHHTTVAGLDPDPAVLNAVYARCASHPDYLLPLYYRSLSAASPSYPRTGNLWGWWGVDKGLDYASRIDLWLGADFAPDYIRGLRRLNPAVRVLTSMNAVEHNGLPDDYYLKDIHGNKIEVWPGVYRLNMTKLYVAEYQAHYAYQLLLDGELMHDGVFIDNVMTTQSWLEFDIWGNPVQIDSDEDGIEDDPAVLDAAWKAGVVHELAVLRQLLPHALLSGHSMNVYEPDIPGLFNGVSIGFWTADVIEDKMSFTDLWNRYNLWFTLAKQPAITMIESSPPDQIAYGYDYSPWSHIPASTLEFARTYYPYVRFGLALTLMNDGYFGHEFGDTWHGNDWWYDELDFNLGLPLGPAEQVALDDAPPPNLLDNGGFESPIAAPWDLYAGLAAGGRAALSRDTLQAAEGTASARLDLWGTQPLDGQAELAQTGRPLRQGLTYDVTFWIRSDRARAVTVSVQAPGPDGLGDVFSQRVPAGTAWRRLTVSFDATETVADARLRFLVGAEPGTVWLDGVSLSEHLANLYRREFTNGLVLINGTRTPRPVSVDEGYRRLLGSQAPRYEFIVDDVLPSFVISGTWTEVTYDSGEWQALGPFYHDWAAACHEHSGSPGEARWMLPLSLSDVYTITAWWPAAPESAGWNDHVVYQVVSNQQVVTSTVLDQSTGGDEWHLVAVVSLAPGQGAQVRVRCDGTAPCIADALHVRSRARYNDGSEVSIVLLQPMDGIILARIAPYSVYLPIALKSP